MDEERLTAYCGLYCADCIPSNRALFAAVADLQRRLAELGMAQYAALRADRDEELRQYEVFERVLAAIRGLECPGPCRAGGGNPQCAVRQCARAKGQQGCWECGDFATCPRLERLRRSHGPTLNHNLAAIREHGLAGWSSRRGPHYSWNKK